MGDQKQRMLAGQLYRDNDPELIKERRRCQDNSFLDYDAIVLGNNAWLGGGVIGCPGVTIGDNSVVGAGSVVTRDVPERVFAAGNPARVIREL
jgi:acetyltransferase-like isoleucine patch superfamily enzyme